MGSRIVKTAISTGILFSLVFLLSAHGKEESFQSPRYGGVFRLKSFSDHFNRQLDPIKADSYIFVSEQLYDGLVRLDKNFNIVPSLAEYWEISQDGKNYTFYLRKGIHFHHGKELTAADVKYSFERILNKDNNSPYYHYFLPRVSGAKEFREGEAEHISGFKVKDRYTFEIHWIKPYVSALYLLSMHFCKILPMEMTQEMGERFFLNPSGTGPFAFDHWLRDTRLNVVGVRLKQNESYFLGKPYLEALEFCPHYSLEHFLNGEIDSIPLLSPRLLDSQYQVFEEGSINVAFLGMSCDIFPLDNPEIRRALSLGLNKKEIIQNTNDPQYVLEVTHNYIPPQLPGFFPKRENSANSELAKQMLQQHGYSQEQSFPNLMFFVLLPKSDYKLSVFNSIKSQLGQLGIKLKLRYFETAQEIEKCQNPYLVYIKKKMNFPDPEDIIRSLFYSQSQMNMIGYQNSELDSLLRNAELERSWTKRIDFFKNIEQILMTQVPAVPLFNRQNRVVMQPYVRGVEIVALGLSYLEARKIWLDK
ncbi:MAG: hypothetical protein GF421_10800 [Candidatus Aminicenantes bacterium]|nr:hypothetical protein [Candidatus Aminicenantes bacterium]